MVGLRTTTGLPFVELGLRAGSTPFLSRLSAWLRAFLRIRVIREEPERKFSKGEGGGVLSWVWAPVTTLS